MQKKTNEEHYKHVLAKKKTYLKKFFGMGIASGKNNEKVH